MMDQDRITEVIQLHPTELNAGQGSAILKEIPLKSMKTPKPIKGDIDGITGAKAINLGKINSNSIIYGIINPKEKKIFGIRKASNKTLRDTRINSSDLKKPSLKKKPRSS